MNEQVFTTFFECGALVETVSESIEDEPRGPFLCHGFFVYRMASGWAVLTEHVEPPVAYGLKTCAHALQWIYDHRMKRLRNDNA